MNISELIKDLSKFPPDLEVMILDGFNSGGTLRTINLCPQIVVVSEEDELGTADCEGKAGEQVVRIGYGCY